MSTFITLSRNGHPFRVKAEAIEHFGKHGQKPGCSAYSRVGATEEQIDWCDQSPDELFTLIKAATVSETERVPAPSAWGPLERFQKVGDPKRYLLFRDARRLSSVNSVQICAASNSSMWEYAEIPQ